MPLGTVLFDVGLCRLSGMMARLIQMALRTVRMMGRLFVISTVVVFGSFTVVSSRVLVMFCRLPVMISRLL